MMRSTRLLEAGRISGDHARLCGELALYHDGLASAGGSDRLERSAQRITKVNRSDIETHLATRDARQVQQIADKLLRCDGIPESEQIRRPKKGGTPKEREASGRRPQRS